MTPRNGQAETVLTIYLLRFPFPRCDAYNFKDIVQSVWDGSTSRQRHCHLSVGFHNLRLVRLMVRLMQGKGLCPRLLVPIQ